MTRGELERRIDTLKARPLVLLCRTPSGRERVMSVQQCIETGSVFIHVVRDDLDELLARELGTPGEGMRSTTLQSDRNRHKTDTDITK